MVVYRGSSKIETISDQFGLKGYAVGFSGLVSYIEQRLPRNEVIKDALRTNQLIPEISIRELSANCLIHQDFSVRGASSMFEIYENRVEFTNPGMPLFGVDRFIDSHQSRNERLAESTRRLRICEEKRSGIDRVVHAAEVFQLPAPEFRTGQNSTIVTIFGQQAFGSMDRTDRIRACYQHCALKYVTNAWMTNQSLRDRFKLPEKRSATISQIISQTVDKGLVKPDEKTASKKFAKYIPYWG